MLVKGDLKLVLGLLTKEWTVYYAELMQLIFDLQVWIRECDTKIVFAWVTRKENVLADSMYHKAHATKKDMIEWE